VTRLGRSDLSVSGPFVCRCLIIQAMPRFHTPLVEPGMRISRTRLSWKHHDFAHEKLRVRSDSRIRPNLVFRLPDGNFLVAGYAISCLPHSH
jgi:hypothetical protein